MSADSASLRARFEQLPDDYVLTKEDVDMVPAVLGSEAGYNYSTDNNGSLLYLSAYDQTIETAADLRRLAIEHPRPEDDESGLEKLVKVSIDTLFKIIDPITAELARTRLRMRVLYEMMYERDPDFPLEFQRRYLEAFDRDYAPLHDQLSPITEEEYKKKHAEWMESDKERFRQLVGLERSAAIEQLFDAWEKAHPRQTPDDTRQ